MSTVSETLVEFPIDPKDSKGNSLQLHSLQVNVTGPVSVHAQFKEKDGKPFVSFSTTKTGDYKVSIQHNGADIQNSPMTVNVKVKEAGEQTKTPSLPSAPAAAHQGKHPVKFQVDAKDADGNAIHDTNLQISVSGPENVTAHVQLSNGKFLFSFETSVSTGDFSVAVKHNGKDIHRSPFTVSLAPHSGSGPVKDVATLAD